MAMAETMTLPWYLRWAMRESNASIVSFLSCNFLRITIWTIHYPLTNFMTTETRRLTRQYKNMEYQNGIPYFVACPKGFEPLTHSLGNYCSILLSYGHKFHFYFNIKNPFCQPLLLEEKIDLGGHHAIFGIKSWFPKKVQF